MALRDSTEIQGDILAGFKKDHMTLLFLRFGDAAAARSWLKDLVDSNRLATTRQVASFNAQFSEGRANLKGADPDLNATWVGLSLTYPGLTVLTGKQDLLPENDGIDTVGAFVQGSARRARPLGDVDNNAPDNWLFGADHTQATHAVLTVAADLKDDHDKELTRQKDAATRAGLVPVHERTGATLPTPGAARNTSASRTASANPTWKASKDIPNRAPGS
jgi:hypothetical protein